MRGDDYTAEMAHAAAAHGAGWLDEKCPGWESRIDLERLDLENAQLCVLGQTAMCILGPRTRKDKERHRYGYWRVFDAEGWTMHGGTQEQLGFDVPIDSFGETEVQYEMLTIAWRELIRERLAVPA